MWRIGWEDAAARGFVCCVLSDKNNQLVMMVYFTRNTSLLPTNFFKSKHLRKSPNFGDIFPTYRCGTNSRCGGHHCNRGDFRRGRGNTIFLYRISTSQNNTVHGKVSQAIKTPPNNTKLRHSSLKISVPIPLLALAIKHRAIQVNYCSNASASFSVYADTATSTINLVS